MGKLFDNRCAEEEKAWELFVKRQRLAISAWRAYQKAGKLADKAALREIQSEMLETEFHLGGAKLP